MSTKQEITVEQIIPWAYGDGVLRQATDSNGKPWFSLVDICQSIGVRNPHQAAARLDSDEITDMKLRGATTTVRVVNEPGAYHLLLTSRTPKAANMRRWLSHVVIPQINKTGAYLSDKLSDEIAAVLLTQDRCTDQALVALDQGRPAEVAARLRQAREAQGKLNELIDREPLPITRGVADPVRSPELRKALGLGKHRPQDVVAGYADDVVNEPREYRYPAQYAR